MTTQPGPSWGHGLRQIGAAMVATQRAERVGTELVDPFDERPTWNESQHRRAVQELRALARQWGQAFDPECYATTWGLPPEREPKHAIPSTFLERQRLTIVAEAQRGAPPPRISVLTELCGGRWERRRHASDWQRFDWILFAKAPRHVPKIVLEATDFGLGGLTIACAIRSWDPDNDFMLLPSEQLSVADQNHHAASVREYRRKAAEIRKLEDPRRPREFAGRLTVDGHLDAAAAELEQRADQLDSWLAHRSRREHAEQQALAALIAPEPDPSSKLPVLIERAVKEAKRSYWEPVARRLLTAWDPRKVAELLLADAWFVDLIPRTRMRYCQGHRLKGSDIPSRLVKTISDLRDRRR
jgi:hypothetical protein